MAARKPCLLVGPAPFAIDRAFARGEELANAACVGCWVFPPVAITHGCIVDRRHERVQLRQRIKGNRAPTGTHTGGARILAEVRDGSERIGTKRFGRLIAGGRDRRRQPLAMGKSE